jgi:acetyltransferase-like isoleucine patch superfamily enzyme
VNIDGRKGVSGERPRIKAKKICVLSEQGNVSPGDEASIEVGALTLQAGEGAIIGDDAVVTVYGALTVEAVGDAESSAAVIDSGAVVNAGSVQIKSLHAVQIRDQARLSVDGVLSLVSTQDNSESEAIVGEAVQIQATDLTILSPRKAEIDKSASIKLFGDGKLVSGNEAIINKNVTLNVTGNFFMEAGSAEQCEIKDAQISAGTTSGNCF